MIDFLCGLADLGKIEVFKHGQFTTVEASPN